MVRAAESIVFNIAEGCGAGTQREFARFLGISIKSCCELEAEFELARDYGVLSSATWNDSYNRLVSVRRMLFALHKKVLLTPRAAHAQLQPPTVSREPATS